MSGAAVGREGSAIFGMEEQRGGMGQLISEDDGQPQS